MKGIAKTYQIGPYFWGMDLRDYYETLERDGKAAYAERAGTHPEYLRIHLIPAHKPPDRIPRPALLKSLADASGGAVTMDDVIRHFYGGKAAA